MTVDARDNQTEIRIVCTPFMKTYRSVLATDRSVASGSPYDFLIIGALPGKHNHRIEFKLDAEKEQVEIMIYSLPEPMRRNAERKAAKKEKALRLVFPVHVQPGTRSLVIQQSSNEIDKQIATSMRDFRHRDGIDSDDTDGDDTNDEDDDDDDDDGFIPGPPSPDPSPSLGNSGRAQGSNSHRRSNASEGHDEVQDGDNNDTQLGNLFSNSPHHAADSHEDLESNTAAPNTAASNTAASNTAEDRSEAPATNASASTNKASSTPRGSIASKHETARVTNNAFRLSKDVSGRATSDSQPGFGAPVGKLTSASSAHTGQGTMHPRNSISSSAGETSSSRPMGSSSMAPVSRASASTSRKRPAPSNSDEARPAKRTLTSGGLSSGLADTPRQHGPPRGPGRYQGAASSAGPRPATYSGYGRGEGNASSSRQRPTASEARRDPPARHDHSDHRPSADSGSYSGLQRPGRRTVGSRGFEFSDRYRDWDSEGPARHMAGLNLNHNPSPSRARPARPAPSLPSPPPPLPPRRGDTASGWTPPAGSFNSRPFQPNNQRQGSSSRSARNSGPAGSPQQPQGFNGSRRGNRDRPTRD